MLAIQDKRRLIWGYFGVYSYMHIYAYKRGFLIDAPGFLVQSGCATDWFGSKRVVFPKGAICEVCAGRSIDIISSIVEYEIGYRRRSIMLLCDMLTYSMVGMQLNLSDRFLGVCLGSISSISGVSNCYNLLQWKHLCFEWKKRVFPRQYEWTKNMTVIPIVYTYVLNPKISLNRPFITLVYNNIDC